MTVRQGTQARTVIATYLTDGGSLTRHFGLRRGIARLRRHRVGTRVGPGRSSLGDPALLGTPSYLSPEQAQGARDVDARSDQYALGLLLYEAATGRLPFVHETLYGLLIAIVSGGLAPPRTLRPELPVAFEAAVLRAMARDPSERFATVHDLGAALLPFASEPGRRAWTEAFEARSETLGGARAPDEQRPLEFPSVALHRDHVATTLGATVRSLRPPAKASRPATLRGLLLAAAALTAALALAAVLIPTRIGSTTAPLPPSLAAPRSLPTSRSLPIVSGATAATPAPDASTPLAVWAAAPPSTPTTRPSRVPAPSAARHSPVPGAPPAPQAAPVPSRADGTNLAPILE